jgi:hypothetical protein
VADAALLATLLPLWVVCAVLHVKQAATGRLAWVPVYVSAPADGEHYPAVKAFWPGSDADTFGLAVGDRLQRVGDIDLHGVGPFGFVARVHEATAKIPDLQVRLDYERNGVTGQTLMALIPVAYPWRILPVTLGLVVTGALVLAGQRGGRVALAFFLFVIAYGLHWTFFFGGPRLQTYAWAVVFFAASLVMLPLVLRAIMIFPDEVAPPDGRLPWWPWLFAVFGPISLSWTFGVLLPPELGLRAAFGVNVLFILTMLAIITRNYRRASPIGRRQLKWVVLGIYVGTVPVLLTDVVTAFAPPLWWLHEVAMIAEIFIPVCILMAISRQLSGHRPSDHRHGRLFVPLRRAAGGSAGRRPAARVWRARRPASIRTPGSSSSRSSSPPALVPGQRVLRPQIERLLFREHALKEASRPCCTSCRARTRRRDLHARRRASRPTRTPGRVRDLRAARRRVHAGVRARRRTPRRATDAGG